MARIAIVICSLTLLAWASLFMASDSSAARPANLDADSDGIEDGVDNCPFNPNGHQENTDGDPDGGDVCDRDTINPILEFTLKSKRAHEFHASTPFYRMRFGSDAAIAFSAEAGMLSDPNAGIGMPGADDSGVLVLTPQAVPLGLAKGYKRNAKPKVVQATWQTAVAKDLYTSRKKPPIRLHTGSYADGAGLGFEIPMAQISVGRDVEIDLALDLPSGLCLETSEADAGAGVGRLTITDCAGGERVRLSTVGIAALGMETKLEDGPDFFGLERLTKELNKEKIDATVGPPGKVGSNFGGGKEAALVQTSYTLMENQADSALGRIRVTQTSASRYVLTLISPASFIARNRASSSVVMIGIALSSLTDVDLGTEKTVSLRHVVGFGEETDLVARDVIMAFENSIGTYNGEPVDYSLWPYDGGTAAIEDSGAQAQTALGCAGCTMTFGGSSLIRFNGGGAGVGIGPGGRVGSSHPCLTSDPIDFVAGTGRCAEGLGIRASFVAETLRIEGAMSGLAGTESDIQIGDLTVQLARDPNVTDEIVLHSVIGLGCSSDAGVRVSINPADGKIVANVPVQLPDGCTNEDAGMAVAGCQLVPLSSPSATGICNLVARRVTLYGPASMNNPEGMDLTLPAGIGVGCGSRGGRCEVGPKSFNAATGACEALRSEDSELSMVDGFYVGLALGGPANVDAVSGTPLAFDDPQAVPPAHHCFDKITVSDNEIGVTVGPNTDVQLSRCRVEHTQFGAIVVANGGANAATVANTTAVGSPCPTLDGVACRTPAEELACPSCKQGGKSFLAVSAAGISALTKISVKQCEIGLDQDGNVTTGQNPFLPDLNVDDDLKVIVEPNGLTIAGRSASLGKAPLQVALGADNLLHPLVSWNISASNVAWETVAFALDNRDSVDVDQSGINANDICYSAGGGLCVSGTPLVATAETDGEALILNTTAASLASSVEKPAGGDVQGPFKCYSSEPRGTPPPPISVTVVDLFTGSVADVDLLRPLQLCTPVNKDREGVPDPIANLQCYEIQGDQTPNVSATVSTQFGTHDLQLVNAKMLCIPAVTVRGGGELWDAEQALSHFKCYLTSVTSSTGSSESEVLLEDDFEAKGTAVHAEPFMVCNAAQALPTADGLALSDPEDHLACYQISDLPGEPQFAVVDATVTDQFNLEGQLLDIVRSRVICERAKAVLVP